MPQSPCKQENVSLDLTASLAPMVEFLLELQLVGEEQLSPAHILGQGPHLRGDVVTGRLNYRLPQFVRDTQLEMEKVRSRLRHTWVHLLMKSLPSSCCL